MNFSLSRTKISVKGKKPFWPPENVPPLLRLTSGKGFGGINDYLILRIISINAGCGREGHCETCSSGSGSWPAHLTELAADPDEVSWVLSHLLLVGVLRRRERERTERWR